MNTISQSIIPLILVASRIPSNPFNPSSFGMLHIPMPNPSLESNYQPSMSHLVHNGIAQIGYRSVGIPQLGGGYNSNQLYNPVCFSLVGGNTIGIGLNAHHNTPNWSTGSLLWIMF